MYGQSDNEQKILCQAPHGAYLFQAHLSGGGRNYFTEMGMCNLRYFFLKQITIQILGLGYAHQKCSIILVTCHYHSSLDFIPQKNKHNVQNPKAATKEWKRC